MRAFGLALAITVGTLQDLAAQDVAARLDGRVPASVVRAVARIAQDAETRGLPVEPLIQKAIEGGAKGVPADRVIWAVRALAVRLDESRSALREAGIPAPSHEALESGADAINAGLDQRHVRELGLVSRPPYDPAIMLRVAATLTALGVTPQRGVRLMENMMRAGRGPNDLMDLPNEVQVDMARGATADQAAEALETGDRAAGPQGQHGQDNQEGHQDQQGQQHPSPHKP
ncbi:MAG: hypothetical protein M3R21_00785 [Candidatus Dormibacteraeota bacterium]|nr:hypothetical protein [Candidatus Dormibacteraeota bacterium]